MAEQCAKGAVCLGLWALRKSTMPGNAYMERGTSLSSLHSPSAPAPVCWKPCHGGRLVMQKWTGHLYSSQLPGTLQE